MSFWFVLTLLFAVAECDLKLKLNSNDIYGTGSYTVTLDDEIWLESGQMDGYFHNQWFTTNKTRSDANADIGFIELISSTTQNSLYDDFGGAYVQTTYEWIAGGLYSFSTKFKVYTDGKAISFVQSFPNGMKGTNFLDASAVPSSCAGSVIANPFLTFPAFNVDNDNSLYANGELGYLTWHSTFSTSDYGSAPLSANSLSGVNSGPVVLHDEDATYAILVSSNDHFMTSTQTNEVSSSLSATYMYNNERKDSVLCLSTECYAANGDYNENIAKQGNSALLSATDIIALTLWYSSKYTDNYIATTASPPDSSYTVSFNNGYIYRENDAEGSRLALDLFYNQNISDHATVADEDLKTKLLSDGYVFNGTQGYITSDAGEILFNNDWRLGITSTVLSVPDEFEHETVIVVGSGISDVMNEWSVRLQSKYSTERISGDNDILTAYLGYWTDNGAYYYGDDWSGATVDSSQNLSCCSYEIMKKVKLGLDELQIPVQYWQMDDWWYVGNHPSSFWGGVKAVSHWQPPTEYYPGGLEQLSNALQVPFLLYGPYFQPENDWSGEYEFIPQSAGYVLPVPEQSYAFYSTLFEYGIQATSTNTSNTGMIGYEVDFMSCLTHTPYFQLHVNAGQEWLNGMNAAAAKNGIIIQYCMANPSNLMSSLSLSQVTNGRASGDYAGSTNWNIGPNALFWHALSLKPSKDNLWTSFNEPIPESFNPNGKDHNSTELHAIIAVLSLGPVGISDAIGYSNHTLIMKTCQMNGRLLQPSKPVTAIDDQFIFRSFKSQTINVWQTTYGPMIDGSVDDVYRLVLAIDMRLTYNLTYTSFYPVLDTNYSYIIRSLYSSSSCVNGTLALQSNCVSMIMADSKIVYSLKSQSIIYPMLHSFELVSIVAVSLDSIVFLGELDKYVGVSQHRFSNLVIIGQSSLSVDIYASVGEVVLLTLLKPQSDDWIVYEFHVEIVQSPVQTFFISF